MSTEAKVKVVMSRVLRVPEADLSEDSSPDTIESWDSMEHINLILAIEEEFAFSFREEQMLELVNLKAIVNAADALCKA